MALRVSCVDGSTIGLLGVQQACEDARFRWLGGFLTLDDIDPILDGKQIDVLISEIRIGQQDILEYWLEQSHCHDTVKLIVYTHNDNITHIARAASCHAWDFISKRQSLVRLIQACRSARDSIRSNESAVCAAKEYLSTNHNFKGAETHALTARERQALAHLAYGLSNREISSSMQISQETVKEHVQNILRKLKTKDRTAAAVWAIRHGLPKLTLDGVAKH
jgi:DNA-binding NarL/FixJ family response regulator